MAKVLIWILVILGAMIIMRIISQKKHKSSKPPTPYKRGKHAESMVRCAHCGIYLPRSEALMSNHHTWCSLEHAKLGPRN